MRLKPGRTSPLSAAALPILIDAARCWRAARDARIPVQPALYARLIPHGFGLLAPVVDALLAMIEAAFRRRFRARTRLLQPLSIDEQHLLELLADDDAPALDHALPNLRSALRAALRSTRIMLRRVAGEEAAPASAGFRPAFFGPAAPEPDRLVPLRAQFLPQ